MLLILHYCANLDIFLKYNRAVGLPLIKGQDDWQNQIGPVHSGSKAKLPHKVTRMGRVAQEGCLLCVSVWHGQR
jgi:hypothetical protein